MTDIERYYAYKASSGRLDGKEGGLSYRTLQLHSIVLNLIFKEAMRRSLIRDNPCELAKIPKNAAKSEKKQDFYNVEQCKKLLDVTEGTPLHDMIYLTFIYGLRRSELMGLKWEAVDFENNTLTIQHTVVLQNVVVSKDSTKNKSSHRTYPLLEDIREILLSIRKRQKENKAFFGNCYNNTGYVFTHENGTAYYPSYPSHALQKVLEKYDLPHIRWHNLRHSCASVLLLKGWSMKDVSEWLGHADINTTMNIYAHIDMEHKRTMSMSLNGMLS